MISTPQASYYWSWELLKGIARKMFSSTPVDSHRDPVDYFEKITKKHYDQHHSASNENIFCSSLKKSQVLSEYSSKACLTVYDLGVGFGDLFESIALPPTTELILVDFVQSNLEIAAKRLSVRFTNIQTILADLRSWHGSSHQADLVFSINVLPYIKNVDCFLSLLASIVKKNGHCCLIYPIKNPVWEEEFDGIRISFYDPNLVNKNALKVGLRVIEQNDVCFALPGSWGKITFSIAVLAVFQKEM